MHQAFPQAAIYVRGYDRRSVMKLSDSPAEYVVREVLESALRMARMALEKMGLSEQAIEQRRDALPRDRQGAAVEADRRRRHPRGARASS